MVSIHVIFGGFFILIYFCSLYFGDVFSKTIIPLVLDRYEMIIVNSYPMCAHGIIVKYINANPRGREGLEPLISHTLLSHFPYLYLLAPATINDQMNISLLLANLSPPSSHTPPTPSSPGLPQGQLFPTP